MAVVTILFTCLLVCGSAAGATEPQGTWKAGVATVVITPEQPMWMAGYASRTKPSEGKIHDLNAKALALEDAAGTRLVIVTMDILAFPREFRDQVEKRAGERYQLRPENLLLSASHTHSGPEIRGWRVTQLWDLSPEQLELSRKYTEDLQGKLVELVGRALTDLGPAQLAYLHASAGFGMNRRLPTDKGYANAPNPGSPSDHDVPVLRVTTPDGKIRAIVFGYACHNTTLSLYEFCGDYAGFAQRDVEEAHPRTTALFMSGCGGDQNPYPRGTVEWARRHGRSLADAVEAALLTRPRPVRGPLKLALGEATLELERPPSVEDLKKQASSPSASLFERRLAETILEDLEKTGRTRSTYPYLVHMARFGDDLTMIALAGEVVVDYSLRLKKELAGAPVWVAGYCNEVFGYVPSLRVLKEGGYEAGGARLFYGTQPTPFAPSVEKLIVDKVQELVHKTQATKSP